jgi:hypothetical protein
VKAFVPVRIRLVTPISMGRSRSVILQQNQEGNGSDESPAVRVRFAAEVPPFDLDSCPS